MDLSGIFTAIIVDTNAYDKKANDFCGFHSALLPSFFETLERLNIQLISHPVLQGETLRHIVNGELSQKNENAITAITKYKTYLEMAGCNCDSIIDSLRQLEISEKLAEKFRYDYRNAIMLPYANPEKIFELYFSGKSPFSLSGKKKSEFPDAFVIEALKNYLHNNQGIVCLVVTEDADWANALKDTENITITSDIDSALKILHAHEKKSDCLSQYVGKIYEEIATWVQENTARDVWFSTQDFDCQDDIDVEEVRLVSCSDAVIPLRISSNELTIQVQLDISVDGSATVIDEDDSVWDNEEKTFIFTSFSIVDFFEASGEVTAEIKIEIDSADNPKLSSIKLLAAHGVDLSIDLDNIEYHSLNIDPVDVTGDIMDTLEDQYRQNGY